MAQNILAFETSCDETSAAVLSVEGDKRRLASLVILSQDVHRIFGGVVPELASRAHLQTIGDVTEQALAEAGITQNGVNAVAVTTGPGLVGALLVGVMFGKTMALSLDVPLIGVHHLEGHLFAPTLEQPEFAPPFVALLVSIVIAGFSGLFYLETERIWIFLAPLVVIPAVYALWKERTLARAAAPHA